MSPIDDVRHDMIRSDPTHFYNNNNESWIILYACQVIRCVVNYSERHKDINLFIQTHGHGHGHTHTYEYMFLLMTRTYYFKSG